MENHNTMGFVIKSHQLSFRMILDVDQCNSSTVLLQTSWNEYLYKNHVQIIPGWSNSALQIFQDGCTSKSSATSCVSPLKQPLSPVSSSSRSPSSGGFKVITSTCVAAFFEMMGMIHDVNIMVGRCSCICPCIYMYINMYKYYMCWVRATGTASLSPLLTNIRIFS